jgi:hypothetical protein
MKQHLLQRTALLFLLALFVSSCAIQRTNIEKRRYRKGLHIDQTEDPTTKENKQPTQQTEFIKDSVNLDLVLRQKEERKNMFGYEGQLGRRSFLGFNVLPMESLRLGYHFLVSDKFSVGLDISGLYKFLFLGRDNAILLRYPTFNTNVDYFSLRNHTIFYSGCVKWFFQSTDKAPQTGFFAEAELNYTPKIEGLKTDYFNKNGVPVRTSVLDFLSENSRENKWYLGDATFATWGFDLVAGYSTYIDMDNHFMFNAAIGYHYLKLPDFVKEDKIIDGETFYYHVTPMWIHPMNFPLCTQLSMLYRF